MCPKFSSVSHPLEDIMANAGKLLLIGDSSEGRFPSQSFHNYTKTGVPFACLDIGGLSESRGGSAGHLVHTEVSQLPEDLGKLAVVWVKPRSAMRAVELAHEAGCTQVWFSFGTGHRDAVGRARDLAMEVVEIGRCPVHYLKDQVPVCRMHTTMMKLGGAYRRPPQTDPQAKRRELI